jgi:hypothetical protein
MQIRGHYDGKVIVLDEPAPPTWSLNTPVLVAPCTPAPLQEPGPSQALLEIAAEATDLGLPADFSEQHDHYLYGTPKR